MRIIDLDKLETYFQKVNVQHLRTLSTGGISTLNMVAFILGLKRFFENKVSLTVAGKELTLTEKSKVEELLPIILDAKKHYDNITIFFHFDDKPYNVIYMYDDDGAVWVKMITTLGNPRDYIFEARLVQQICQDNELELNPYTFDILFRMYNKKPG